MSFDFRSARGEAHVMGAHINGEARWTVKLATGFYENTRKGLPTASGMSLVSSAAALKQAPERPGLFVGAEDLGQKLAASSSQRAWASTLSECCFASKAAVSPLRLRLRRASTGLAAGRVERCSRS